MREAGGNSAWRRKRWGVILHQPDGVIGKAVQALEDKSERKACSIWWGKLYLGVRKNCIAVMAVKPWGRFSRDTVGSPSLDTFKLWWNKVVESTFEVSPALNKSSDIMTSRAPFQIQLYSSLRTMEKFLLSVRIPLLLMIKSWSCTTETLVLKLKVLFQFLWELFCKKLLGIKQQDEKRNEPSLIVYHTLVKFYFVFLFLEKEAVWDTSRCHVKDRSH